MASELMNAVCVGDEEEVQRLLDQHGRSCFAQWKDGYDLVMKAIRWRHRHVINLLLAHGAKVNGTTDMHDETPLHLAVRFCNEEFVHTFLRHGADINATDEYGGTPLHTAVRYCYRFIHLGIIEELLKNGAKVDMVITSTGKTPLHLAISTAQPRIVRLLLIYGASVNVADKLGDTPMFCVTQLGLGCLDDNNICKFEVAADEMSKALMEYGADVNMINDSGKTLLHVASEGLKPNIVRMLLNQGLSVNALDGDGQTPLFHVVDSRYRYLKKYEQTIVEISKDLLECGADVNVEYKNRKSILQIAVENGLQDLIKCILLHRPDINDSNTRAFHLAVEIFGESSKIVKCFLQHGFAFTADYRRLIQAFKQCDTVKWLMKIGVNLKLVDFSIIIEHLKASLSDDEMKFVKLLSSHIDVAFVDKGHCTLLHHVVSYALRSSDAEKMRAEAVRVLLERGSDTEVKDIWGKTPLHRSIERNDVAMVKMLLAGGADANARGESLRPALHVAAEQGYADVVRLLLTGGADVTAFFREDFSTALHLAAERGHVDVVKMLLAAGANVDARLKNHKTALHLATRGHADVVKILLASGADANARQGDFTTALHLAADWRYADVARVLLVEGADVNITDSTSASPLYRVAAKGYVDMVRILLAGGADVNRKHSDLRTALHVATEREDIDVVTVLLENGADVNIGDKDSTTPLHIATAKEYISRELKMLIERRAIENAQDKEDKDLIYHLLTCGNDNVVRLLLEWGASVNVQDSHLSTPLHKACQSRQCMDRIVKILTESGADVNAKDEHGKTPFHCWADNTASAIQGFEVGNILLEHGAELNAVDNNNDTVLHLLKLNTEAGDILEDLVFKLVAADLPVDAEFLECVEELDEEATAIFLTYKMEVEILKTEIIPSTNVAVADLLTDDLAELVRYARYKQIMKELGSDKNIVANTQYIALLRNGLQRGLKRCRLMEEAHRFFNMLSVKLPNIPVAKILAYLSNQDLIHLVDV